jgi:hypothetical protein
VEKCMSCQYYDRKHAKPQTGGAPQWGQCRQSSPMLNPVNAKSYMIEGVWPTVRDDDWCGDWKMLARRVDGRVAEALNAPLISAQSVSAQPRVNRVMMGPTVAPTITPVASPSAAVAGNSGDD